MPDNALKGVGGQFYLLSPRWINGSAPTDHIFIKGKNYLSSDFVPLKRLLKHSTRCGYFTKLLASAPPCTFGYAKQPYRFIDGMLSSIVHHIHKTLTGR